MNLETLVFMKMKPIITNKIITNCIGTKNYLKTGILTLPFHYTKGKGYYENYKEDADFDEYGINTNCYRWNNN